MTIPPPLSGPPLLGAHVSGFAAFVISKYFDAAMDIRIERLRERVVAGHLDPRRLAEVVRTWSAIEEAAQAWETRHASVDGSAEGRMTEMPAGSTREAEISPEAAAGLLGVTSSRVRQLARDGKIVARKADGRWLVDRGDVEIRRQAA